MSDPDRRSLSAHNEADGDHGRYLEESKRRYVNAFRLLRRTLAHPIFWMLVDSSRRFPSLCVRLATGFRWRRSRVLRKCPGGRRTSGVGQLDSSTRFLRGTHPVTGTYDIVSCMAVAEHLGILRDCS